MVSEVECFRAGVRIGDISRRIAEVAKEASRGTWTEREREIMRMSVDTLVRLLGAEIMFSSACVPSEEHDLAMGEFSKMRECLEREDFKCVMNRAERLIKLFSGAHARE